MKSLSLVAACLLGVLMLAGCPAWPDSGDGVTVAFSIPSPVLSARALGSEAANEFLYIDLTEEPQVPQHTPIVDGVNTVIVDRNGIYLFALVYNPALDPDGVPGAGIELVGTVGIAANDLRAFPIGEESTDMIDLGALSASESGYNSSLPDMADLLAIDPTVLDSFADLSRLLKKFANPDTDRNGVYDFEEGLFLRVSTLLYFSADISNVDFDEPILPFTPADLVMDGGKFLVECDPSSPQPSFDSADLAAVVLSLPADNGGTWPDASEVTSIPAAEGGDFGFAFLFDNISGIQPPYDGSYILDVEGVTYSFEDVDFTKPLEEFEDFVFPVFKIEYTVAGDVELVQWKWMEISDGVVSDAAPELVQAMINTFDIHWEPGGGGDRIDPASIPLDFYNPQILEPEGLNVAGAHFACGFRDLADNWYYWQQSNGTAPE